MEEKTELPRGPRRRRECRGLEEGVPRLGY